MFIFLSKVLPQLVLPLGLCLELSLLGLVLLIWRRQRGALLCLSLAFLVVLLPSLPVCSDALLRSLERRHTLRKAAAHPPADAIIVLGGGTSARGPDQPDVGLGASGGRLLHAFRLFQAGKARVLLLSGGSLLDGDTEAEQMREILGQWGVPAGAMIREDRSRNTRENAIHSLRLARARGLRRLLLVTSAFHMERALGVFRREARVHPGMEIIAAPTGAFAQGKHPFAVGAYLPDAGALSNSTLALREHMGIWVYRLRGWI